MRKTINDIKETNKNAFNKYIETYHDDDTAEEKAFVRNYMYTYSIVGGFVMGISILLLIIGGIMYAVENLPALNPETTQEVTQPTSTPAPAPLPEKPNNPLLEENLPAK